MELERSFRSERSADVAIETLGSEETLLSLFPGKTDILKRVGDRVTAKTHYTALGREGDATFHFDYLMDGGIQFEKVCDGRVWKALSGRVEIEEDGDGCRVTLRLSGSTKSLVPEFTIKGPMEDQIGEMTDALAARLSASS
jgi:hypothetical protein